MIKGIAAQLKSDNLWEEGCYGVQVPDDDAEIADQMNSPSQGFSGKYRDDLTGQLLKDSLVQEARAKELLYFHSRAYGSRCPRRRHERRQDAHPSPSVGWMSTRVTSKTPTIDHGL